MCNAGLVRKELLTEGNIALTFNSVFCRWWQYDYHFALGHPAAQHLHLRAQHPVLFVEAFDEFDSLGDFP